MNRPPKERLNVFPALSEPVNPIVERSPKKSCKLSCVTVLESNKLLSVGRGGGCDQMNFRRVGATRLYPAQHECDAEHD